MKQSDYTTRVLQAEPGHMLTEAADVDIAIRTLTRRVYLASGDLVENWKEITDAEAESIRLRQEAAAEADND